MYERYNKNSSNHCITNDIFPILNKKKPSHNETASN